MAVSEDYFFILVLDIFFILNVFSRNPYIYLPTHLENYESYDSKQFF